MKVTNQLLKVRGFEYFLRVTAWLVWAQGAMLASLTKSSTQRLGPSFDQSPVWGPRIRWIRDRRKLLKLATGQPTTWQLWSELQALHTVPWGQSGLACLQGKQPAGKLILSYAQTSHEKLDMQMSYIEKLRAATFADYLWGVGAPLMTLPPKPSSTQRGIVGDKWNEMLVDLQNHSANTSSTSIRPVFFEGSSPSCRNHTQRAPHRLIELAWEIAHKKKMQGLIPRFCNHALQDYLSWQKRLRKDIVLWNIEGVCACVRVFFNILPGSLT